MATNTNNYGFKKPEENDFYSIEDQNRNWDLVDGKIAQLNSDWTTISTYNVTPSNTGIPLYYRKLGPCKSISTAGTHIAEWVAGTTYGLATVGGVWKPSYGWSKRIIYKSVSNVPYYAMLQMESSGDLFITPETVTYGGTLRIHEVYF